MSEENIAVARKTVEALNSGDLDALIEVFDPDCVFEPQRATVEGAFRGHAGVRSWFADTQESFDTFRLEVNHEALGGDRVLSVGSLHICGRGSGIEAEIPTASISELRDRRIWRFKDHVERSAALEAADEGN